jgi:hypothetical protein
VSTESYPITDCSFATWALSKDFFYELVNATTGGKLELQFHPLISVVMKFGVCADDVLQITAKTHP